MCPVIFWSAIPPVMSRTSPDGPCTGRLAGAFLCSLCCFRRLKRPMPGDLVPQTLHFSRNRSFLTSQRHSVFRCSAAVGGIASPVPTKPPYSCTGVYLHIKVPLRPFGLRGALAVICSVFNRCSGSFCRRLPWQPRRHRRPSKSPKARKLYGLRSRGRHPPAPAASLSRCPFS